MSSKLDQSLDSIIDSSRAAQKSQRSKGQSNQRSNPRGNDRSNERSNGPIRKGRGNQSRQTPYSRDQSQTQSMKSPPPMMFIPPVVMPSATQSAVVTQKVVGDTIHISNLDKNVTSDDLNDIFKSCGHIKNVNLHFDQSGHSIGTATITFQRKNDAAKAADEFDGAEVDGRVMHIKLIGEVVKQTQSHSAAQSASMPMMTPDMMAQFAAFQAQMMQQQQPQRNQAQQSNRNQPRRNDRDQRNPRDNAPNTQSKRGGRGASRGGRRGGEREKKPVTAEDLDAQLDTYHTKKTAAASTDAAPDAEPAATE